MTASFRPTTGVTFRPQPDVFSDILGLATQGLVARMLQGGGYATAALSHALDRSLDQMT